MRLISRARDRAVAIVAEAIRRRLARGRIPAGRLHGVPSMDNVQVVMCLWNRPERLAPMVEMLAAQTTDRPIDLSLWNNSRADRRRYDDLLAELPLTGSLASIRLVHSPFNLGSIGRFYFARDWNSRGISVPIIVVDDDQDLPVDFVARARQNYVPGAVTAFWAFTVHGEYHERSHATLDDRVDHIGPGGCITSSDLFVREFFEELPRQYWFLDDLWLSHWVLASGGELRKLDVAITFVEDDKNQYPALIHQKIEAYRTFRDRRAHVE